MALGAQGIHCGTAFLATVESFGHDDHKVRVLAATAEDTAHTDIYALNWQPNVPVRVIRNSVIKDLGPNLMEHRSDLLPREIIASEDGRPFLRYSTDSPLRKTAGNLEAIMGEARKALAHLDTMTKGGAA